MIARFWSARTAPGLVDSYLQHFVKAVHPELRKISGFRGASICVRPEPGSMEILVTTYWQSFQAIDAFAGSDRESAVVASDAASLLTEYDHRVKHFEVALAQFPPMA